MITNYILAPILVHMITAVLLLFNWQRVRAQKIISIIGNSIAFILCVQLFYATQRHGFLILQAGGLNAYR